MRRHKVVLREGAVSDLTEIYDYIVRSGGSRGAALRIIRRIRERCQRIGDVPNAGRSRDDLTPGLRTVPFEGRAVIAYLVIDLQVRITNVFYGGRDFEALYASESPAEDDAID